MTATRSKSVTPKRLVDDLLSDAGDTNVVVGPVVWQPSDGASARHWYFSIATCGPDGEFRIDAIVGSKTERRRVMAQLVRRGPIVVHDVDDELAMARLCAALWPGDHIAGLCREIEAERAVEASRNNPVTKE